MTNELDIWRICLVGLSGFGEAHYETVMRERAAGRAKLVGVTVINPDQVSDKVADIRAMGCPMFSDAAAMFGELAGKADLCMLPVGIGLHRAMTESALHAGMHVVVEKPAAGAIQDVLAMQESAHAADRVVSIAFQDLYSREILEVKQALLSGRIGQIRDVRAWGLWPREINYYGRNSWAGALRADGQWVLDSPANNACAHELMMGMFLAGPSLTSAADAQLLEAEAYRANDITNCDTLCMRIKASHGTSIFGVFSHAVSASSGAGVTIEGTSGRLEWNRHEATWHSGDRTQETVTFPNADDLRTSILAAVRQRNAGHDVFICDPSIAAAHTRVINGVLEASPIHTIPETFIARIDENGSRRVFVKTLDAACRQALLERRLFSELDVPWASPAGSFALTDYNHFSGGQALASPPLEQAPIAYSSAP